MKAVHDAAYATPPASFREFRWRLQHLSEERVGRRLRQRGYDEDAAYREAMRAIDGAR